MESRRTRNPVVLSKLEGLARAFAASDDHRRVLQTLDCDFVYAAEITGDKRFEGVWIALIRLSPLLEDKFGIHREIPVIYSPHRDLQGRTIARLPRMLDRLPPDRRGYAAGYVFIWTPDPRLTVKMDQFSRTERILLPLGSGDPNNWLATLASRLYKQDLYREKTYVTGDQFFGRRKLLAALRNDLQEGRVSAVFGTRKTGKTSILKELVRTSTVESDSDLIEVFIYQDLEHLPSLDSGNPIGELLSDLAESIRAELKLRGLRTRELAELGAEPSIVEFRRALTTVLQHSDNQQLSLVLILDEIEHICPPNVGSIKPNSENEKVPQFFGVLRKLVQELDNFNFAVAGLASAIVESGELFGRHNPLFSLAQTHYMAPFSLEESSELLRGIGSRLGMEWSDAAIASAQDETGGQVVLLRELAASVWQKKPVARTEQVRVSKSDVETVILVYRRAVRAQITETVEHIKRYYPAEYELCGELLADSTSFQNLSRVYPAEVQRLQNLGIATEIDATWRPTKLLELGWSDGDASLRKSERKNLDIEEQIVLGEGKTTEFKSSARVPLANNVDERAVLDWLVKAILGFLNSDGGRVFVGVDDKGMAIGLKADLEKSGGSRDRLLLYLTDKIEGFLGSAVNSSVDIFWTNYRSKEILVIDVPKSDKPVFPLKPVGGKSDLFVRQNANTRVLSGAELLSYNAIRFNSA